MKIIKAPKFNTVTCKCGCVYEYEQGDNTTAIERKITTDFLNLCEYTFWEKTIGSQDDIQFCKITSIVLKCPICGKPNVLHYQYCAEKE